LVRGITVRSRSIIGNFVPSREGCRLPLSLGLLPLPVDPNQSRWPAPFAPRALHPLHHYYGAVRWLEIST
jgi:hypothetical protein